jgi:hypothetical protein
MKRDLFLFITFSVKIGLLWDHECLAQVAAFKVAVEKNVVVARVVDSDNSLDQSWLHFLSPIFGVLIIVPLMCNLLTCL